LLFDEFLFVNCVLVTNRYTLQKCSGNPWDKKAKTMGDYEYKHMVCVHPACVEKAVTPKPGEELKGRQEILQFLQVIVVVN
jgi:D-hexose-6-phosphate mutarotase